MIENFNYTDESDEEGDQTFYSVCAENKMNAMIDRLRGMEDVDEDFHEPEEFENEAVSMAIQQHGLRNQSSVDSLTECGSESNENHCSNQNGDEEATTSKTSPSTDIITRHEDYNLDEVNCPKSKQRKHCNKPEIDNYSQFAQTYNSTSYEFNDVDFLNEAVAAAIRKKGLSSSPFNTLQ